jgi:hypothetical protein
MKTDEPDDPAAQDPGWELDRLRQNVILNLARAMEAASQHVLEMQQPRAAQQEASPEPQEQPWQQRGPLCDRGAQHDRSGRRDRDSSLELVKLLLPTLLPLMRPPPETYEDWPIPQIPVCPSCGAGPGAHWPEDCPKNPKPPEKLED